MLKETYKFCRKTPKVKGGSILNIKDHGGDMKAKPRRISMTDEEDFELKLMAAGAGVSRGTLIRQMVRSLAARLQTIQKEMNLPGASSAIVPTLIQCILLKDMGIMTQQEFDRQIAEYVRQASDVEWYDEKECERRARADVENDKSE